jgi:hypothetical protein
MADIIPPPPAEFTPQNQWAWLDFYKNVRYAINNSTNVTWINLNFASSNITSIVTRRHRDLQDLQGGAAGDYQHLTTAQLTSVSNLITNGLTMNSKAGNPTTSDIPAGYAQLWKNTSTAAVKLWVNDGGTLKSVALV